MSETSSERPASTAADAPPPAHDVVDVDEYAMLRCALPTTALIGRLHRAFARSSIDGPAQWRILCESTIYLGGDDVRVASLAGWRRERMPELPADGRLTVAPDWIAEMDPPGRRRLNAAVSRPAYGQAGVRHLWLVDPVTQILEAFELDDGRWRLIDTLGDDDTVSLAPFEAITFRLSELWD